MQLCPLSSIWRLRGSLRIPTPANPLGFRAGSWLYSEARTTGVVPSGVSQPCCHLRPALESLASCCSLLGQLLLLRGPSTLLRPSRCPSLLYMPRRSPYWIVVILAILGFLLIWVGADPAQDSEEDIESPVASPKEASPKESPAQVLGQPWDRCRRLPLAAPSRKHAAQRYQAPRSQGLQGWKRVYARAAEPSGVRTTGLPGHGSSGDNRESHSRPLEAKCGSRGRYYSRAKGSTSCQCHEDFVKAHQWGCQSEGRLGRCFESMAGPDFEPFTRSCATSTCNQLQVGRGPFIGNASHGPPSRPRNKWRRPMQLWGWSGSSLKKARS